MASQPAGGSPASWVFNRNYKDLSQVEQFYPAYLAVYQELEAAGLHPYNDSFKGRIPGAEGPSEDTAIYLLQTLRAVRELEAKVAGRKAEGWRDFDPAELGHAPVRFAGVAEYGFYMGGTGWREWPAARLTRLYANVIVLPARARTNGHLVAGRLLVKD